MHALVIHRDAVAHTNGIDLQRCAARHAHARLNSVGNLLEMNMARNNLVLGGNDSNQRTAHLFVGKAIRFKQAAVWRPSPAPS